MVKGKIHKLIDKHIIALLLEWEKNVGPRITWWPFLVLMRQTHLIDNVEINLFFVGHLMGLFLITKEYYCTKNWSKELYLKDLIM